MLELKHVCKQFKTKSNDTVNALNGIDCTLGDKGMVFILGKSGSGKSTLLNLIGGLDAPTSGEIIVDGASMSKFTQLDFERYRNDYVGFVFQEYNLLPNLNVGDNIALALQLTDESDVPGRVSDALRQVELDDKYLKRRVNELSGGEKQRIAIARSVVKNSKIILADEPTGNLDSATGESIWKILKRLSLDRLVIVVSHDDESAEKYADRIIRIADGAIVSDNGSGQVVSERKFVANTSKMSFANRLKLAWHNLFRRKVRTVFTIVLVSLCTAVLMLITMINEYSPLRALDRYNASNGPIEITLWHSPVSYLGALYDTRDAIVQQDRDFFDSRNCKYSVDPGFTDPDDLLYAINNVYKKVYRNGRDCGAGFDLVDFYSGVLMTADGTLTEIGSDNPLMLNSDQAVLTYDAYAAMFSDAKEQAQYVTENETGSGRYTHSPDQPVPEHIGETFSLQFYTSRNELIADGGEYTLYGVIFNAEWLSEDKTIIIDSDRLSALADPLGAYTITIYSDGFNGKLSKLLSEAQSQRDFSVKTSSYVPTANGKNERGIYSLLENMENDINLILSKVMWILFAIMLAVCLPLVINVITMGVVSRKREIGIMSAIGTSRKDITSVFMLEVALFAAISFVLSLLLSLVFTVIFNAIFTLMGQTNRITCIIPYITFGKFSILAALGISVVLPLLAALIPVIRLTKIQPMEQIRYLE